MYVLLKKTAFTIMLMGMACSALADTAQATVRQSPSIGSAQHLTSILLGLMGIILLIFLLAWFYRKAAGGVWLRSSAIKIVSALALGTRERLLLIDVGGKQMLLGVTAQNISTLHVFDEPIITDDSAPPASDFGEKLQGFLQRNKSVDTQGNKDP